MASYDEIFGKSKGGGGGAGSGVGTTKRREEARERQAEQEQQAHDRELAKQETVKETVADEKDVVLSNPRWSVERAFFTQKVKASVDVAIPKSRGDVSKVTLTFFAILPNGKRSKQIGAAEGHPDSNGTITVDVVLHYPDANERVIVKPVESYQYLFTAKHKYSKEITGPEIAVLDHLKSTARYHPNNINLEIPGGIGDLHGSISEWVQSRTSENGDDVLMGGVSVTIEFRNRNQKNREKYHAFKWKQFIESNAPKRGNGEAYEDILESELNKRSGKEHWYGDGQDRRYQIKMYEINDGGYFTDKPGRDFSQSSEITWYATLVLFGIDSDEKSHELASLKYGFVLKSDEQVSVSSPVLVRKAR